MVLLHSMDGVKGFRLVSIIDRLHSHLPLRQCGGLSIRLEFSCSSFSRIFENPSKDECSNLEGAGSYLTVVVGSYLLLIGSNPDGGAFFYFVCLVQVLSKFLIFVPLILHDGPGRGHAYFDRDDCVHSVCESERGVSYWSSKCRPVGP